MSTVGSYRGPNIVTRGLVLHLDAASPNSYYSPNGGTVWKDVSGNGNDGTLVNGTTFSDDAFVFDGANDLIDCGNDSSLSMEGSSFTMINIAKPIGGSSRQLMSKGTWSQSGNYQYRIDGNGYLTWWLYGHTPQTTSYAQAVTAGEWIFTAMTYVPNTLATLYLNGQEVKSTAITGTLGSVSGNFQIGAKLGVEVFNGDIAIAYLYNRALTAQEVLQNFNATKDRFGL